MEKVRILVNPRRNIQRLGFLKHLVLKSSKSSVNNPENIGKELIASVSKKAKIELEPEIKQYIKIALTSSRYAAIREKVLKDGVEEDQNGQIFMEIQDIYLSDPRLPSHRGKLIDDDWYRYPSLALDLKLIRKSTYSIFARGQALLLLTNDEEKKAFISPNINDRTINPFLISKAQSLLLLYSFIDADGDVIKSVFKIILNKKGEFSDKEIGNELPDIYRSLAKKIRSHTRSGDDLVRIQQLRDTAEKIEEVSRKSSPGGKNAREHASTPRLEPYVDMGLINKPNGYSYLYKVTEATQNFFKKLINEESIDHFLHNCFFAASNESHEMGASHDAKSQTVLDSIYKAYKVLKNPIGYAPIYDVCLLAGIISLTEQQKYFEISEGIQFLKKFQKERSRIIAFNVDRWGDLSFVKFKENPKKSEF